MANKIKTERVGQNQNLSLTMDDVTAAQTRIIEARKTRSGVSTRDYVLSQVDGKVKTLEMAQAYLAKVAKKKWVVYNSYTLETVIATFNTKSELNAYADKHDIRADQVALFSPTYPDGFVFMGWDEIELA